MSAQYGLYITIVVVVIENMTNNKVDNLSLLIPLFPEIDQEAADISVFLFNTTFLSILISYFAAFTLNLYDTFSLHGKITQEAWKQTKIKCMKDILSDSPMDQLFMQSYIDRIVILITLDSGKVYVGVVTQLGEPNESEGMDQEIGIKPVVSGYRVRETHKVVFNMSYEESSDSAYIVIKQDLITTACRFDPLIYSKANKATESSKATESGKVTEVSKTPKNAS